MPILIGTHGRQTPARAGARAAVTGETAAAPRRPAAHVVNGDVFLCEGFAANGEAQLLGAIIGGQLGCEDANRIMWA